ncbi:MAG TPA: HU family DNA-binding protein, partial [Limnobacter sp.]|nr:HU family DNA-binding protein [Limnobacter sp.]
MTKSELINQLVKRFPKLPVRDTDFAVKSILDTMTQALAEGQRIEIR